MGTLALSDFQSEILSGLANRTDISLQRIVNVLNLSQSRLSRFYDFSDMAKLSVTTLTFQGNPTLDKFMTLPPLVKTIHTCRLIDNTTAGSLWSSRKMVEKPWRWFDLQFPVPEVIPPAWPSIYVRWGNVIEMVPPPMFPYQVELRYMAWPTPFNITQMDQTSDFDNKDDILINASLAYLWRSLGRADMATTYEGFTKEFLEEAILREDTRPDMDVSRDLSGDIISGDAYWQDPFIRSVY